MPDKPNILLAESERFSPVALSLLEEIGNVEVADLQRNQLLERVADKAVLWVRLRNRIDAEILDAAPRLVAIATPTTGLNHLDLDEAGRRGIEIVSLKGEIDFLRDVRATAEHTIGLMLSLLRSIPAAAEHVRSGGWDRDLFVGTELCGRTIGIVGYGRLGRLVGRYLKAFDANVIAADPNVSEGEFEGGVTPVKIEDLLQQADIVSLHVNLCPETEGFFGQEYFGMMKPGALLINTSRGELVEEEELLRALVSGRIGGAALDVVRNEHLIGTGRNPILEYGRNTRNLIITPHIGGCTAESREKTEVFLAQKLQQRLGIRAATN